MFFWRARAIPSAPGGTSFVITPGSGSWDLETRIGAVMDGKAAEHIREAIPVLASYCDVMGVRAFAEGRDLATDLSEPAFRQIASLCDKPLVNLESAANHPCQALADWKTLDDLDVPRRGRFVLSWANHPRALPLAHRAARDEGHRLTAQVAGNTLKKRKN